MHMHVYMCFPKQFVENKAVALKRSGERDLGGLRERKWKGEVV